MPENRTNSRSHGPYRLPSWAIKSPALQDLIIHSSKEKMEHFDEKRSELSVAVDRFSSGVHTGRMAFVRGAPHGRRR